MLKLYSNGLFDGKGKKNSKMKITFRDCVFLSGDSSYDRFSTREVKFRIGDYVTFLNIPAVIMDIMTDDVGRIIYKIKYKKNVFTTVQQELLLAENKRKADFPFDDVILKDVKEVGVPSEPIVELEEAKVDSEKSEFTVSAFVPEMKVVTRPIDFLVHNGSSKHFSSKGAMDNVKIEDIIRFLNIENSCNWVGLLINIMTVYKFLLQNPSFDMTILKDKESLNLDNIETVSDDFIVSLAFQHLLEKVGIESDIVLLRKGQTKESRAVVEIPVQKEHFFFDVAGERFLYENDFPYLRSYGYSMACLGTQDYEPYYQPLGVLSEDERTILHSPSFRFASSSLSDMVLKGIDREVGDMHYLEEKKNKIG